MGALPKKRQSRSKRGMRRSHDRLKLGAIILCSHCRRPHLAHHVCPNCGYYAGREVVPEKIKRVTE
ncbi:MAG TPA: 50S ribosomal protein L32 [Chloroflexota bacterium]|nr:50S ribosomal protein L32 [Chloroflexota bacterium]